MTVSINHYAVEGAVVCIRFSHFALSLVEKWHSKVFWSTGCAVPFPTVQINLPEVDTHSK